MRIYTGTGDQGTTGLFGGGRVDKDDPRVEAYGAIDELNACLGVVIAHVDAGPLSRHLSEIQSDLFTQPLSVVGPNKSGDLHLGVLYNFNTETIQLPAFAVRVEADLPTRVTSRGIDGQVTGIHTRSFGRCGVTSMRATRWWGRHKAWPATARIA